MPLKNLVPNFRQSGQYWILSVVACAAVFLLTYVVSMHSRLAGLREVSTQRLEFYAANLESALEKYDYLPFMLSLHRDVPRLLLQPRDVALQHELNVYLQLLQEQSRAAVIYVLDNTGTTLAASNWREPGSFVGHNYAFRPYFKDAVDGRQGRFYAIGTTTGAPGYFLSSPVYENSRLIGVAVVKVSLADTEEAWRRSGEDIVVADANGVAFLSSVSKWRYRTLTAIPSHTLADLREARQYGAHPLDPIASLAVAPPPEGQRIDIALPEKGLGGGCEFHQRDTLAMSQPTGRLGWQLLLFTDLDSTRELARNLGASVAFATAFSLLLFFYLRLRKRRQRELAAARAALQRAHDELELRIRKRTVELTGANDELRGKIAELNEAQQMLQETQNDLVQAGKLAVLGQMAAGVTHELNQPLAAMRTLSDNALVLIERGQTKEGQENLATISQLTDRMGRIVGQLKAFSRKSNARLGRVSIETALDNALALVDARARQLGVEVSRVGDADAVAVLGDDVRLEQVFINLMRNALDALAGRDNPLMRLGVEFTHDATNVAVTVSDNGPGIPPEVAQHLFEPFYTTKASGGGLGLGLTISLVIVRAMGGELTVHNNPEGGATFTAILPRYREQGHA